MEHKKATPIKLRDVGKYERWLQDQIIEDTSILGLGDLVVIQHEKQVYLDERSEFLMYDPVNSLKYEIEIVLDLLDDGYIIDTFEYWEMEQERFSSLERRVVILTEDVTNNFFDIIKLMSKSIPVIVIQFNVFKNKNQLLLKFVKILDLTEAINEEDQEIQVVANRNYWESRATFKSVELVDLMPEIVKTKSKPIILYNKERIGWGIW